MARFEQPSFQLPTTLHDTHSLTSKETLRSNATQQNSFATTDRSQAQTELIQDLYTEVEHLRHVIHALVVERDQPRTRELDMAKVSSGSLKAPTMEMPSSSHDDLTLVSDGTIQECESDAKTSTESDMDLNSFVPLRRCGTPCSAPPQLFPISDTVRPCLIKRCSSFTSLEGLGISRGSYDSVSFDDEEDEESFDETQEEYIYFPRVNSVYVEHRNPWCIMPISGPRPPLPKPRQPYELESNHLSFSSLWLGMQNANSDDKNSIDETISCVGVEPTPSLSRPLEISNVEEVVEDADFDSYTLIPFESDDNLDIPCPPRPITPHDLIQDYLENHEYPEIDPLEEEDMVPIAQPKTPQNSYYHSEVLSQIIRTRNVRPCYPSRAFRPSLSLIFEMDEILIPILESSPPPTTLLRKSKQSVADSIQRLVEFDLQSAKQNKKTWFDMAMEDEEDEEYDY